MYSLAKRFQFALLAILVLALMPGAATAAPVPPGNPAATQYTEAFPTAGGQQDAENGKGGKGGTPSQVLGKQNAQQLESQGEAGKAAAALAAETAPSGATAGGGGSQGKSATAGGKSGTGRDGEGSGGDSALGEVASQATGSSFSDGIDLLLPLAILATVAWLLFYLLRRRQRPTE